MREPRTAAGRDLLAYSVQYDPADADRAVTGAKIADVEDEAAGIPAGRELRLALVIRLRRHHRGKCARCGHRRILFSIDASPLGVIGSESERLCAEDAGLGR